MPGALFLGDQPDNLTPFADQVMRRDLGFGIAQSLDGEALVLHLGIMDHQHVDRHGAFVVVGREHFAVDEFVLAGGEPLAQLAEIGAHPISPSPAGRTAPSTSASGPL